MAVHTRSSGAGCCAAAPSVKKTSSTAARTQRATGEIMEAFLTRCSNGVNRLRLRARACGRGRTARLTFGRSTERVCAAWHRFASCAARGTPIPRGLRRGEAAARIAAAPHSLQSCATHRRRGQPARTWDAPEGKLPASFPDCVKNSSVHSLEEAAGSREADTFVRSLSRGHSDNQAADKSVRITLACPPPGVVGCQRHRRKSEIRNPKSPPILFQCVIAASSVRERHA